VLAGAIGQDAGVDLAPSRAVALYAGLRLAVGVALLAYFWRDWARIGRGLVVSIGRRRVAAPDERWAWLVVVAALPGCVAIAILTPHARPLLRHPLLAAGCLAGNGLVMLAVWWWWRRSPRAGGLSGVHRARLTRGEESHAFAAELSVLRVRRVLLLGLLPVASLVPGISGVGLMICAALIWGLTHDQAARAALIIVTPVLLTWGLRDLPELRTGHGGEVHGTVLLAMGVAVVAAYLATALLVHYFKSASLRPFGYYCVFAGVAAMYWVGR
jgi:undecaprenyl-diphosphatase